MKELIFTNLKTIEKIPTNAVVPVGCVVRKRGHIIASDSAIKIVRPGCYGVMVSVSFKATADGTASFYLIADGKEVDGGMFMLSVRENKVYQEGFGTIVDVECCKMIQIVSKGDVLPIVTNMTVFVGGCLP